MATTILFSPTRCIMGGGKFDTNYRYMRAGTSGSTFPLPRERTVRIAADSNGRTVMWRWSDSVTSDEWRLSGATGLGDPAATLVKL